MLRHEKGVVRAHSFCCFYWALLIAFGSVVRKHITAARLFICVKSFPPSYRIDIEREKDNRPVKEFGCRVSLEFISVLNGCLLPNQVLMRERKYRVPLSPSMPCLQ